MKKLLATLLLLASSSLAAADVPPEEPAPDVPVAEPTPDPVEPAPTPDPEPAPAAPPPAPVAPPAPAPAPPPAAPVARDPRAERFTLTAERASLHGDCKAVRMLGQRVRQLDPDYFKAAFVTNAVISGCRQGVKLDVTAAAPGPSSAAFEASFGPHFGSTVEIAIGGGLWSGGGDSLKGPGGPAFGVGAFVTPKVALTVRLAGASHIGDGLIGYLGFLGPSVQGWLSDRAFVGGGVGLGLLVGCGSEACDSLTGLGLDFRAGYTFHPAGESGGHVSFEVTDTQILGQSLTTFSVLLGYQTF